MSLSTFWSQHKSALIGVLCLATVYGAFAVLHARPTPTPLRRRGAVHRRRAGRGHIELHSPTADAPLGRLSLWKNGQVVVECNIATERIPAAEGTLHFRTDNELIDVRALVFSQVIDCCRQAGQSGDYRVELERLGLGEIIAAFTANDATLLRDAISNYHAIPMLQGVEVLFPEAFDMNYVTVNLNLPSSSGFDDISTDETEADTIDRTTSNTKDETQDAQLRTLLYHIAAEDAKRQAYDHHGFRCDECGGSIKGVRWRCLQCYDFDLCSTCETTSRHNKTHVFVKIKIPTTSSFSHHRQPTENWYAGDLERAAYSSLDQECRKTLASAYDFSEEQIDALFDQFCCTANTERNDVLDEPRFAISRPAFNRALCFGHWQDHRSAEHVYACMFGFYDTDGNGLIGFKEFVSGLAYLRGPQRFQSLSRAIQGFDTDKDGFVDRKDIRRLLRAKFSLQSENFKYIVKGQERQQIREDNPVEALTGSQPISSILQDEELPLSEPRVIRGKVASSTGDMEPLVDTNTILRDEDPWVDDDVQDLQDSRDEVPDDLLDAFEDMVYGPRSPTRVGSSTPNDRPTPRQHKSETTESINQEVLWKLLDSAFDELLNGLFEQRETHDDQVLRAAGQLAKFRSEIELAVHAENAFLNELAEGDDHARASLHHYGVKIPLSGFCEDGIFESLKDILPRPSVAPGEREASPVEAPDHSGDQQQPVASTSSHGSHSPASIAEVISDFGTRQKIDPADVSWLFDLPEVQSAATSAHSSANRADEDVDAEGSAKLVSQNALLEAYLEVVRSMRAVKDRGGCGRLSIQELADAANENGAMRDLMRSWLDWASF